MKFDLLMLSFARLSQGFYESESRTLVKDELMLTFCSLCKQALKSSIKQVVKEFLLHSISDTSEFMLQQISLRPLNPVVVINVVNTLLRSEDADAECRELAKHIYEQILSQVPKKATFENHKNYFSDIDRNY